MLCPSRDATRAITRRMWLSHHHSWGFPPVTASCVPLCHPADPEQVIATQHGVTTDISQAVPSLAGNMGNLAKPSQPRGAGVATLTGRRWRRSWVHCACAPGRLHPVGPASACARPVGASSWHGTTWPGRERRRWDGAGIPVPQEALKTWHQGWRRLVDPGDQGDGDGDHPHSLLSWALGWGTGSVRRISNSLQRSGTSR